MPNYSEMLCEAGALMFDRRLTDMAGGNISVRDGDTIYMSPRYAGSRYHWQLKPDDLVTGCWADDEITQNPKFSREGWSHLYVYRAFPEARAVVHAHPFYVMPFASLARPIEPVLESTQKFGTVAVTKPAPAHSKELAEHVVEALQGQQSRMLKQAAVVIIPYHGIICVGQDFLLTLDALERINTNAYCLLARKMLE